MDDSRDFDGDIARLLAAHARPEWDPARAARVWEAVMDRLHGRRPPRRRLPSLLARFRPRVKRAIAAT
jgi:hypothetical protein